MASSLPNGSIVNVSSILATAIVFSQISNAIDPVVALPDDHDLVDGDIVLVKSGWSAINDVVTRLESVTETSAKLKLLDTTDENRFTAGAGKGSLIKVTEWIEVSQIKDLDASGGEQQSIDIQYLSDDKARKINTFKSPKVQKLIIDHDSTLPFYPVLRKADQSQEILVVRMYVPKANENRYWAVTASFDDTPNSKANETETVTANFNMQSPAMTFHKLA